MEDSEHNDDGMEDMFKQLLGDLDITPEQFARVRERSLCMIANNITYIAPGASDDPEKVMGGTQLSFNDNPMADKFRKDAEEDPALMESFVANCIQYIHENVLGPHIINPN